jgi:DNA-binding NarL/FixJ family response regulator
MFRALLVEDDPLFRSLLSDVLTTRFPGLVVDEAGDSETALEQLNRHRPDLIFVDIGLPGRNGILLTRDIKSIDPGLCVVMLTSHDLPEYREAAAREGADWYICKMSDHCRAEIVARVAQLTTGGKRPVG